MNLILDGNNVAFRSHMMRGGPGTLTPTEINVEAASRFFSTILRYSKIIEPTRIFTTWDIKQNPVDEVNFRKAEISDYKEHRNKEARQQVYGSIDLILEGLKAAKIPTLFPYNLEADDIIAYLCRILDGPKIIISSDSDLLQLVSDDVTVHAIHKGTDVTPDNFSEFTDGVPLDKFVLYKSILGDTADGIPGLPRYGKIKAKKLIHDEHQLSRLSEENKTQITRNIDLIDLTKSLDQSPGEEQYYWSQIEDLDHNYDLNAMLQFGKSHGIAGITHHKHDWSEIFYPQRLFLEQIAASM